MGAFVSRTIALSSSAWSAGIQPCKSWIGIFAAMPSSVLKSGDIESMSPSASHSEALRSAVNTASQRFCGGSAKSMAMRGGVPREQLLLPDAVG